ncbi:MAG: hypothetical protein AB7F75_08265 [Planctomycetota bacterium]
MKIRLDKIASSTRNCRLPQDVILSDAITAKDGYVIAVRALEDKSTYNQLELVSGRMTRICRGDLIAGVLGERRALRGYTGIVPERISMGDEINVLNLGGVLGQCISENPDLGPALRVEVLGAVQIFPSIEDRVGVPAHIGMNAIQARQTIERTAPLIIVSGTCMSAGKTGACCKIVQALSHAGLKVGATKLTGVSLMKDTLDMKDFGADHVNNFTDAGAVSTASKSVVSIAKGLLHDLNKNKLDAIVVELGDGILGEYGVQELLSDSELKSFSKCHVCCANDPVAAWGAVEQLGRYGIKVDVMSGPATDNQVGVTFIEKHLGLLAVNARTHGLALGEAVMRRLWPEGLPTGQRT